LICFSYAIIFTYRNSTERSVTWRRKRATGRALNCAGPEYGLGPRRREDGGDGGARSVAEPGALRAVVEPGAVRAVIGVAPPMIEVRVRVC
jgi:hypothetical protein